MCAYKVIYAAWGWFLRDFFSGQDVQKSINFVVLIQKSKTEF